MKQILRRQIELLQQLRHADVAGFVEPPAGLLADGTGEVGLPCAGISIDNDVACLHEV